MYGFVSTDKLAGVWSNSQNIAMVVVRMTGLVDLIKKQSRYQYVRNFSSDVMGKKKLIRALFPRIRKELPSAKVIYHRDANAA